MRNLAIISVGALILTVLSFAHARAAANALSEKLAGAGVEVSVSTGSRTYQVSGGAVTRAGEPVRGVWALPALQLAYAHALAERMPLMALAGTDPARMRVALERLAKLQEDQAAGMPKEDAQLIQRALYPLPALTALADLEERRLAFVAEASGKNLRAYDRAMRAALFAYRTDLARFRTAFSLAVPEDAPPFVAGDRMVTRDAMLAALDSLERGVRGTALAQRARHVCVAGFTRRCDTDLAYPAHSPIEPPQTTPRERAFAARARSLYDAARPQATSSLVLKQKGACTGHLPGPGIFAIQESLGGTAPLYLGDLPLVATAEHAATPFYALFAERGSDYAPMQPFAPYVCPEYAAEFADILTAHEREALSAGTADVPPSFALQEANRSTRYDAVLQYVAHVAHSTLAARKAGVGTFDTATLFYTRSAFLGLFLAHNPSVVGTQERFFAPSGIPREEQPFSFLSELSPQPSDASLIANIRLFDEVHGN